MIGHDDVVRLEDYDLDDPRDRFDLACSLSESYRRKASTVLMASLTLCTLGIFSIAGIRFHSSPFWYVWIPAQLEQGMIVFNPYHGPDLVEILQYSVSGALCGSFLFFYIAHTSTPTKREVKGLYYAAEQYEGVYDEDNG